MFWNNGPGLHVVSFISSQSARPARFLSIDTFFSLRSMCLHNKAFCMWISRVLSAPSPSVFLCMYLHRVCVHTVISTLRASISEKLNEFQSPGYSGWEVKHSSWGFYRSPHENFSKTRPPHMQSSIATKTPILKLKWDVHRWIVVLYIVCPPWTSLFASPASCSRCRHTSTDLLDPENDYEKSSLLSSRRERRVLNWSRIRGEFGCSWATTTIHCCLE